METLGLDDAASFLKMNAEVLRRKANAGEIPGRKTGRRWLFIDDHLADWVSGRYPDRSQGLRVLDGGLTKNKELEVCQFTDAEKLGGYKSQRQTETEYNALLKPATKKKPKNYTTD